MATPGPGLSTQTPTLTELVWCNYSGTLGPIEALNIFLFSPFWAPGLEDQDIEELRTRLCTQGLVQALERSDESSGLSSAQTQLIAVGKTKTISKTITKAAKLQEGGKSDYQIIRFKFTAFENNNIKTTKHTEKQNVRCLQRKMSKRTAALRMHRTCT